MCTVCVRLYCYIFMQSQGNRNARSRFRHISVTWKIIVNTAQLRSAAGTAHRVPEMPECTIDSHWPQRALLTKSPVQPRDLEMKKTEDAAKSCLRPDASHALSFEFLQTPPPTFIPRSEPHWTQPAAPRRWGRGRLGRQPCRTPTPRLKPKLREITYEIC